MFDLVVAAVILLLASLGAFAIAMLAGRKLSPGVAALAGLVVIVLIVLFGLLLHGDVLLARILPFSGVIVLGNWFPVGTAALAGLVVGQATIPVWRRSLAAFLLLVMACYAVAYPLIRQKPTAGDLWTPDGVCLQTDPASCSPCSAATLLRRHGIDANEREMIDLCITNRRGTPRLGVYRGLNIKTRGTPWDVEAFHADVDQLRRRDVWPVLLFVRFEGGAGADPRYERQWGWMPGVTHAVVVFGFSEDGKVDVADPSIGREQWALDDLKLLWHGDGFRLVKRSL